MIGITSSGSYNDTESWLARLLNGNIFRVLDRYGQLGVDALSGNTPVESGLTAQSWGYTAGVSNGAYGIEWFNTNVNDGVQIAIIIQYGHGTGTGGFVSGIDYINPAIQPVFDLMIAEFWNEVKK